MDIMYKAFREEKNQSEASAICRNESLHLPVFFSMQEHNDFRDFMKKNNLSLAWLPQKRTYLGDYQWLDQQKHCMLDIV